MKTECLTDTKKISIITVTLNRRELLKEAIDSVVAQNYPNFQHIVIDGGSNDGTVELLQSYDHLTWISEADKGQADAMNKGLRISEGEIFAWLNSDDTYPENTFWRINEIFKSDHSIALAYGRCNIINKEGKIIGNTKFHNFDINRLKLGYNNINTPAVFADMVKLKNAGFMNENLRATFDLDMWIRISNYGKMLPLNEFFSNLRLHDDSGLMSEKNHLAEHDYFIKEYGKSVPFLYRLFILPFVKMRHFIHQSIKMRYFAKKM